MAYLDMYNSEHKMGHNHNHHQHLHHHQYHHHHHHHDHDLDHNHSHNNHLMVSPRISFSNDFVDAQQAMRQEIMRSSARPPAATPSDFEFSVTSYSMMSADELFFKGRLLPFKDTNNNNVVSRNSKDKTTSSRVTTMTTTTTLREELLHEEDDVTFRPSKGSSSASASTRWKSLLGLKRAHSGGSNSKKAEKAMLHEEAHVSKTSQELLNEEVEIGI